MTRPLLLSLLLPAVAGSTFAQGLSIEARRDRAIRSALAAAESRVVRLRYFGASDDSLGSAAAPVTGWRLDERWVLTSVYGLRGDPAAITGQSRGEQPVRLELVARDNHRRLALLRQVADRPADHPDGVSGRPARVGETAIALGAADTTDASSVSVGVISAIDRHGGRAVQTDAAVSPGNYGGPLIGLDGALLGVIAPLAPAGMSAVQLYDSGIGFAIPPAEFSARLNRMAAGETIEPGWLGAAFSKGDPLRSTATITSVIRQGPADAAGLAKGDTLLSLANHATPTVWRLKSVLSGIDAGQSVPIVAARSDGTRAAFQATLQVRPLEPQDRDDQQKEEPDQP